MSENNLLDTMLHPVRMRIIMTLSGNDGMTPLQIAGLMPEIPQATLYRHINRLAESGLLIVASERQVRGTTEKVYALNTSMQTHLSGEDVQNLTKEDHLRYFTSFMATLVDEFSTYLRQTPKADLAADGVGYGQVILYMSDADLMDFSQKVNAALLPYITAADEGGSSLLKKRIFTTVMVPAAAESKQELKG